MDLKDLPSVLQESRMPISDRTDAKMNVLADFINAKWSGHAVNDAYIESASKALAKRYGSKRIVFRSCYSHMLPIVEKMVTDCERVSVSGTPGIGKTIFGLFLLRSFVEQGLSVVYWNDEQATLFTLDKNLIRKFGLKDTCSLCGDTWHWGAWKHDDENLEMFLLRDDVVVIHDPAQGFIQGGNKAEATKVVYIVSFGHAVKGHWYTKLNGAPNRELTMPVFDLEEILTNKGTLFPSMNDGKVMEKYRRFGGSIRFWGTTLENKVWEELRAKALDVAKTGSRLTARTEEFKGSFVHVSVEFDKNKPPYPEDGSNDFEETGFILGSAEITEQFSQNLASLGRQHLTAFMGAIRGEKGAEAVYGVLFEQYAHDMLQCGGNELNIRVAHRNGNGKFDGHSTIKLRVGPEILRFSGQEANGIKEAAGEKKMPMGTYFLPESSTFPTYDAAVVIPGENVGLHDRKVGLLLQMTVSGATGLRRKPEHSVKHYMRTEMADALKDTVEGSKEGMVSYTAFCVPSACFYPFVFQPEQLKESESETVSQERQADLQFVIEIPEFMPLPVSEKPPAEILRSGRVHRYELRNTKRMKLGFENMYATTGM